MRLLLKDEAPVAIGSRAFDILLSLARRAGEVVSKDELVAAAWPNQIVDEVNLRYQVAVIRRALGDGPQGQRFLTTIPGRGYCLVVPVQRSASVPSHALVPTTRSHASRLPLPLTRVIGRTTLIPALRALLVNRRLLSLIGPGGVGKTTVALAVAHELESSYADGATFIDLATVTDPEFGA